MSDNRTNRRQFNRSVAAAAAAVPLLPAVALAAPQQPEPRLNPAEVLTNLIRQRWGQHLSDEQVRLLRERIQTGLNQADTLRKQPLNNSDEPDYIFQAE